MGDTIGSVTNRATNMISLRDGFDKDSEEYKILSYRIDTMMNYQQNAIDRIKGVVARPIPTWWLYRRENKILKDDDEETVAKKMLYKTVAAELKPWFFIYRYSTEKNKFMKYDKSVRSNCKIIFGKTLDELRSSNELTDEEAEFLRNYDKYMPVSRSPGTMNRICFKIEDAFQSCDVLPDVNFDRNMLKNSSTYTQEEYDGVKVLYDEYNSGMQMFLKRQKINDGADEDVQFDICALKQVFVDQCYMVCPNSEVLSNIVVDLCYTNNKNKTFAWDVAGEQIYKNVLSKSGGKITFPVKDDNGDIEFYGDRFSLQVKQIGGDEDVNIE
jgi:hypothetical protein